MLPVNFKSQLPRLLAITLVFVSGVVSENSNSTLPAGEKHGALSLPEKGVCAHRGASWTHPENTIPAIKRTVELGAHQIELDVRLTSDGKMVLVHDGTLLRTTNVDRVFPERKKDSVESFTFAEIRKLDAGSWKDQRFAGEKVLTLTEAFEHIPQNMWVNLDVKGGAALGEKVAEEVVRLKRTQQTILSIRNDAVPAVKNYAQKKQVKLILNNMNRKPNPSDYISATVEEEFDFIQLIGKKFPDQADLEKLKTANVQVNYCCSNDAEQLKAWWAAGIDFPLVDNLDVAMQAAAESGIAPLKPVWKSK